MTSSHHPVQLHIEKVAGIPRVHIVIRLALLLALGAIGCSSVYWALYLALPALVAAALLHKGGERYLAVDGPRIVRGLRWLASAYAYLWLLSDVLPTAEAGPVDLRIDMAGAPTPRSALLRLLWSLPALLLVAVLSAASAVLWVVAAVWILVTEHMPPAIAEFLSLTLRVELRLIAYHLSLVERYPSLENSTVVHAAA